MKKDFIKERIATLITLHQISEKRVSRELGCSPGYIQSLTSGSSLPSFDMFFKICDYFELTPAEFFDENFSNPEQLHRLKEYSQRLRPEQTEAVLNIMEMLTAAGDPKTTDKNSRLRHQNKK